MSAVATWSILLLALAAAVMFLLSWRLYRWRADPGMRPLMVFAGMLGIAFAYAAVLHFLAFPDALDRGSLRLLAFVGLFWGSSIPWILFALEYTGRSDFSNPKRTGLLTVPLLIVVAASLSGHYTVVPRSVFTVLALTLVLSIPVLLGYWIIGAALLVYQSAKYDHTSVTTGLFLGGAVVALVMAEFFGRNLGTSAWSYWGTIGVGGLLSGIFLTLGIYRSEDFASTAAAASTVGREAALEDLDDAVFILDSARGVVRMNKAARRIFDFQAGANSGRPFDQVMGATVEDLTAPATYTLNTIDGARQFDITASDLSDEQGRQLGLVVSFHDVTERELREQRIGILNRVLRHNLRNKLEVVRGHAEVLPQAEDEVEEFAGNIEEAATDLLSLGEQARQIEKLLAAEREREEPTDVATVVETVGDQIEAQYPGVTVETAAEGPLLVSASPDAAEHVLLELADNAAKHNSDPDPLVRLEAEQTETRVRVRVIDNGTGLPEHERVALEAQGESPLEHGSGLGLWAVRWIATSIGGAVTYEAAPTGGASFAVEFPVATETPESAGTGDEASAHAAESGAEAAGEAAEARSPADARTGSAGMED